MDQFFETSFFFFFPFFFQDTQLSWSFISLFQSFLSVLLLMASITCLPPVSLPSPPDSHILLPPLLSTQASNSRAHPDVLLKHLHNFSLWQLLQKLESASSLICLSHPTDTHLQILLAPSSKCSCSLNPFHHFHPVCSGFSRHSVSHTLLQTLPDSSPRFHALSL